MLSLFIINQNIRVCTTGKIVIGFADDRDIENFLERFGKRS